MATPPGGAALRWLTFMAGLVMSATALGSIPSAPRVGKLADRMKHWIVIAGSMALAACLLVPRADA